MTDNVKRPSAEEIILYDKDPKTKIATITVNRPDKHNAMTIAARHRFSDIVHRANVDDDVKVLVIRGAGDHFGTGDDLPEMADLFSDKEVSWLHDFRIGDDEGVSYPPKASYRHLASVTQLYAKANQGMRDLQDFKKISIVEVKGYCYGWQFYLAGDADLVISSDDALFGHASFRYVGWAARMWQWALMMGLRKFQEMVFTGRPFTAKEMFDCNFVNSVVPRDQLEAETAEIRPRLRTQPPDRHRRDAEDLLRGLQATARRIYGQHSERLARIDAADGEVRWRDGVRRGDFREGAEQRREEQRQAVSARLAFELWRARPRERVDGTRTASRTARSAAGAAA